MLKFIESLGRQLIFCVDYVSAITRLFFQTVFWVFVPPIKSERTFYQSYKIGIESLPIVSLVALFIGVIMALQTAYQMQKLSSVATCGPDSSPNASYPKRESSERT